jgi:hypothetical protein
VIGDAPGQAFLREIAELLQRKREIDGRRQGANLMMVSYDLWLADAVALLLMIASVKSDIVEDKGLTLLDLMREIIGVRLRLDKVEGLQEKIAKGLGVEL